MIVSYIGVEASHEVSVSLTRTQSLKEDDVYHYACAAHCPVLLRSFGSTPFGRRPFVAQ